MAQSTEITVTADEIKRQMQREDKLVAALNLAQGRFEYSNKINIGLRKDLKKETRRKRIWKGVAIGFATIVIIKSI